MKIYNCPDCTHTEDNCENCSKFLSSNIKITKNYRKYLFNVPNIIENREYLPDTKEGSKMTREQKVNRHLEIVKFLNQLYDSKGHDYGDSFGETYQKLGIISALTRISDKYNRLISLTTKPEEERKVKDESIQDTLLDLSNYCIMTIIEMEVEKERNNGKIE